MKTNAFRPSPGPQDISVNERKLAVEFLSRESVDNSLQTVIVSSSDINMYPHAHSLRIAGRHRARPWPRPSSVTRSTVTPTPSEPHPKLNAFSLRSICHSMEWTPVQPLPRFEAPKTSAKKLFSFSFSFLQAQFSPLPPVQKPCRRP
jgi:hypothetical protein